MSTDNNDTQLTASDLGILKPYTDGGTIDFVDTTDSFFTLMVDDNDPGNLVFRVTENAINTIDDKDCYLFSNTDDIQTIPNGQARILALSGNDEIRGQDIPEWLNGNEGADSLYGVGGEDTLFGGKDNDWICGNLNNDILHGDVGDDILFGGKDNDRIFGNLNNDILHGDVGDDILFGGKGNDQIFGDAGNDVLLGDKGMDMLTGNEGNDTFVLSSLADAPTSQQEADLVMDFEPGIDRLMLLDAVIFSQLTLTPISLQGDGEATVTSTSIQLDGKFLGILQGVAASSLTETDFIPHDLNNIL